MWTTEYPTKPGFYWIRNYKMAGRNGAIGMSDNTEPTIVCVIQVMWRGVIDHFEYRTMFWPESFRASEIVSAEWQGPIEPESEEK